MHLEVLVEEPSAEAALQNLLPRILPPGATFRIHPHNGKPDLLMRLPGQLKGFSRWIPSDYRIVVLVDADRQACKVLKKKLEKAAANAGLITKAKRDSAPRQVLNRIAMEELEAWFFGDPEAIAAAYERIPARLLTGAKYRDPDAIKGGTAEALELMFKRYRYYQTGMPRIEVARLISAHMDPKRNKSRSFRTFREGIVQMLQGETP